MNRESIQNFDRRQCHFHPAAMICADEDVGFGTRPVPKHCYLTTNAWNNMASHLIWLGAAEIERYRPLRGRDPNRALASIAQIIQLDSPYEEREATIADLLERFFTFITLKDGTHAGVETPSHH